MSQRFCLFYAGYTACAPSLYYDQVALYEQLLQQNDSTVKSGIENMYKMLDASRKEGEAFINTSIEFAHQFSVSIPPKPDSAPAYYNWRHAFITTFEGEFPMTKIDHYYFLFGRRLSELICNADVLCSYFVLLKKFDNHPIVLRRADKAIKDMEYGLFKMMASAALLSGEHRHHYFSVFYKELNLAFQPFRALDIKGFSTAQMDELNSNMLNYKLIALNGFNKCLDLLKELGV
ncbi:MAG: hypothetical protein IT236_12220 [Bacteroidia bacterium]|nr:hypothetical protein [Bacteroidia bacterium]